MESERDAPSAVSASETKETPIERIFQKIVGRKMTEGERRSLGLDGEAISPAKGPPKSVSRRKNSHKNSSKLTAH